MNLQNPQGPDAHIFCSPLRAEGGSAGCEERGGREDSPRLAIVPPMLWTGRRGRAARCFPLGPGWASKPLTPLNWGGQGAAPDWGPLR